MLLGYARISSDTQSINRQIDHLIEHGVKKENIFIEKYTGTKLDRPVLNELIKYAREGDVIVISDLTRLSRSTKDLITLIERFKQKGIHLRSLKETWLDTSTASGKLLLTIFSGLSQFERDQISERTKEGLKSARARGRLGGRPKANKRAIETALKMYRSNQHSVPEICKLSGISRATLYNYLKKKEKENANE